MQKLRTDFGRREATSAPYVRCLVKETGILIDKTMREKPKIVRILEIIIGTIFFENKQGALNNAGKYWDSSTYRRCRFSQKKKSFSDEAHFDLGGYVTEQNCRIWGTENPHAKRKKYIGSVI